MLRFALMSAFATLAVTSTVQAATITVPLDHAELIKNNLTTFTPESFPATGSFDRTFNANAGFSFKLPAIAAGEQIETVTFHAGNSSSWYSAGDLAQLPSDVYAMRISANKAFAGADYGSGTNQPGTKVSTNYFTGTIGTLPDVSITNWVSDTGYAADQYLLLRIGTTASDATMTSLGVRWWTTASNAQLIITTSPIPEPATLGLLALSGLTLLRRRHA